MKTINTLVPDIYKLVKQKGWLTNELAGTLSNDIASRLKFRFGEEPTHKPTLRLSRMGPICPRSLWYSIHRPELADPLPPWTEVKFTFGDILEAMAILFAKASGHEVTGEQDELVLDGVVGHRDCVIDGAVVDVKSCSSRAFIKFKNKTLYQDDSFGYLDQLDGYVTASLNDPFVRIKDKGYILAIDKQLGHMALYEHKIREDSIRERIRSHRQAVNSAYPYPCNCRTIPEGKAGNLRLDAKASYSAYKRCCFPGLRTFKYSTGPVDFAVIKVKPNVPEIFRSRDQGSNYGLHVERNDKLGEGTVSQTLH